MTQNVIERALAHRRAPRQLHPVTGYVGQTQPPDGRWANTVTALAGVAGGQDGPASQATFNGPTGVAVLPTGEIVVADTIGNRIRLIGIDPARTVTTIAGDGRLGFRDGPGATAMFCAPAGVVARPDGSVLVADSDNHVIRKVEQVNGVWTVSTIAGGGPGYLDSAVGTVARFNNPSAIAVAADGELFVVDSGNQKLRRISAYPPQR